MDTTTNINNNWGTNVWGNHYTASTGDHPYHLYYMNNIYGTYSHKDETGIEIMQKIAEKRHAFQYYEEFIKREVNLFFTEELKEKIKKENQKLLDELDKLQLEKESLIEEVLLLITQIDIEKEDLKKEIKNMEKLLSQYSNDIFRYQILDFSVTSPTSGEDCP